MLISLFVGARARADRIASASTPPRATGSARAVEAAVARIAMLDPANDGTFVANNLASPPATIRAARTKEELASGRSASSVD